MVRELHVERVHVPDSVLNTAPTADDYDHVIKGEDTNVYADGELVGVYRNIPVSDVVPLMGAFKALKFGNVTRQGAKKLKTTSVVFGYTPRFPMRRNYCAICAMARDKPDVYKVLTDWAVVADQFLQREAPEVYQKYLENVSNIAPHWRVNGTVFTTGQINETSAVRYHRDSADPSDTWNVITALSSDVEGGYTVVPAHRVAYAADGPTMVAFSTPDEIHGVTPIRKISKNGYRYSMIYYTMKDLCRCGTPAEELARIQKWSTDAEKRVRGESGEQG